MSEGPAEIDPDDAASAEWEADAREWLNDPDRIARDQWETDLEYLSDPTQPEYYSTYERLHEEPAPDWEEYSARQRMAAFESDSHDADRQPECG